MVAVSPYHRLLSATALTNIGDGIRQAALPLLVVTMSRDPLLVAGVTAAGQAPWLLFGLFAGAVVDRVDRRRLVVVVDVVRVVLLAALAGAVATGLAVGAVGVVVVHLVAFGCGLAETLRDTAAATLLPRLVDDAELERANGRLLNAEIAGNELLGPPLGGYLFGVALVLPFAVNGGALAIAAALVLSLPNLFAPRPAARRAPVLAETAEGVRWLGRHRELRALVGLTGVFAFTDSAWFAVLVLYVAEEIGLPPHAYGLLLGVGAVGGLLGGGTAARVVRRTGIGVALAGSLALAAAGQALLGLAGSAVPAALGLLLGSFAFGVWNVVGLSHRQRLAPSGMLGRVIAAGRAVATSAALLGALGGGLLASAFGVRVPILLGVPVLLVCAVVAARRFRPGR
ncbi:MFS transporter [Saccharothrix australiensis]|uniref:Putative MFS family arabinose efflux permease n=1 Tax=Saccharothrix australiensis TaxID=2072 RepID=A0A495W1U3_9PSEU|nr:MFS transporter [Saccharothrix australiensis]RKT55364.1 putative MFS family arabinose efflux permease [Saccharothrix australiensis]